MSRIVRRITLQIHGIQTSLTQCRRVAGLSPQTQPIGIALDQSESAGLGHADDLGQIVTHRRLTAGKLHIAGPGSHLEAIHLEGDALKGRVRRDVFPCTGIADGAPQIAPPGHFNEPRTGMLGVFRAQAAIEWAPPRLFHKRMARIGWRLVPYPRPEIRHAAPNGDGKRAVLRAHFTENDSRAVRFSRIKGIFGGNTPQTDGANALCGLRQGTAGRRHRGSSMSISYAAHKSMSLSQQSASRSPHRAMSAPPPVFS